MNFSIKFSVRHEGLEGTLEYDFTNKKIILNGEYDLNPSEVEGMQLLKATQPDVKRLRALKFKIAPVKHRYTIVKAPSFHLKGRDDATT